jgi:hypothetical protein
VSRDTTFRWDVKNPTLKKKGEIQKEGKITSLLRGSSVGIANGYGLDDQGGGVRVPVG